MPEQQSQEEWRNILLELLLAIGHELDVEKQLQQFLPVFLRKLSCQAAAVFEGDTVFYQEYNLLKQLPRHANMAQFAALFSSSAQPDGQVLATDDTGSVYAFELPNFGYLCLKHTDLSNIFRNEMRQLCLRLSYTLQACRQHQLLKYSQRELDQFFALSDNFMCMINPQGHFTKVNSAFLHKLGYSLDELYAIPFIDFIHPEDLPLTVEYFNGLFADDVSISFKNRMLHKNGYYLDLAWDMGVQSSTSIVYATAIDITQQLEIERNLLRAKHVAEQTAQAKAVFLANMSHEIRTPLNGVLGILELVVLQGVENKVKIQLETAIQSGRSLLAIVNDVLDFSKMSAGKLQLEQVNFNMQQLLQGMLEGFAYLAQEKKLQLKLDTSELSHFWLIGDPHRLQQILNNLLGNALKFTKQGHVELRARSEIVAEAIQLTLTVTDTGIGLSKLQQQHMFEAFSQADLSTTRRYGGTGLGLTICKELAELMQGDIQVHSVLGFGSVFTVTAYLTLGKEELQKKSGGREADFISLHAKRILLVEDNETNRQIGVSMLQHLQCHVETAEHGLAAIERLQQALPGDFDAILMDCMMPELDGYDATAMIRIGRAGQHWQDIPVLALTANAMPEDRQKCLDAGMDDYLTKPFTLEQLEHSLSSLLFQVAPSPLIEPSAPLVGTAEDKTNVEQMVSDEPLWQQDVFLNNFKGMEDMTGELLSMFVQHLPVTVSALQQALDAQDIKKIGLLAHSLKSSAAQIGCTALSLAAKTLEMSTKNQPALTWRDDTTHVLVIAQRTLQSLLQK
jgi:PAS domain S-box-containing protein